jgi:uracil-DNA glycosylase family 4
MKPMKTSKKKTLEGFNDRIRDCARCRLSLTRKHVLAGEGDVDARIMLVALSPGEKEDAENQMFIGPSGQILDKLFHEAGIERKRVYMTNLIKCTLPKCRRPKMDEIETCRELLDEEISIIHPEIIVPLGYYATRTILTEYHADPPAARKDFKKKYGILLYSDDQKILPLPHPATLLYDPSFELETIEKYKTLQTLMHECRWYALCPMKRFDEAGRLERKWIELFCKGDWQHCVRYQMEEQGHCHFDWMLPDGSLDESLREHIAHQ